MIRPTIAAVVLSLFAFSPALAQQPVSAGMPIQQPSEIEKAQSLCQQHYVPDYPGDPSRRAMRSPAPGWEHCAAIEKAWRQVGPGLLQTRKEQQEESDRQTTLELSKKLKP